MYVGGTFDLLHPGHLNLLSGAARLGEVWVALNRDGFCKRYKREPVMNYAEREQMLRACRYVHEVVPNLGDEDSKPAILAVAPRYLVHGDDWRGEPYLRQLGLSTYWIVSHGIELVYLKYTNGVSTSEVIARCVSRS